MGVAKPQDAAIITTITKGMKSTPRLAEVAIATGNILPAGVETYCVDINQAVVTKLADRGSHQALGIVTDIGLFLRDLVENLAPHTART